MRTSPLKHALLADGAAFAARYGTEVVASCAEAARECGWVRNAVGLTDFSFTQRYRIPEEKAVDFLDTLLAGNVARTRFGRMLHTFLPDEHGMVAADCYVANNDQEFILICESIVDTVTLDGILAAAGSQEAGVETLSDSTVLLSLDGVDAWKIVRDLFGRDVLGLPYLSIEVYPFEGQSVALFRAGKTSEFGYLLMAPAVVAEALYGRVLSLVRAAGGGLCGINAHDTLRLEGRFFNIHAEGIRVRDPLVLGLQWMIDFNKAGGFRGSAPLLDRRAAGLQRKMIGISAAPGQEGLRPGAQLFLEAQPAGEVVAACHSGVLNRPLGLAVLPIAWAYAGLDCTLGSPDGPRLRTISMPPILPKSLGIRLDEM